MQLELLRQYFPKGVNGRLLDEAKRPLCQTIELPWKNNLPGSSCIPEGSYALVKRYSPHLKQHLWLQDVPGRAWILIHAANDALKELKGCIAPVTVCTAAGKGLHSRDALNRLLALVYPALDRGEAVHLVIRS